MTAICSECGCELPGSPSFCCGLHPTAARYPLAIGLVFSGVGFDRMQTVVLRPDWRHPL